MGADLYINSLPDEGRRGGFEVSEEAVRSGYFRDAYNCWGLFSVMSATLDEEISWWQISRRTELFSDTEESFDMTPEGCKIFWEEMKPKIREFLGREKLYKREYLGSVDEGMTKTEITKADDVAGMKEHAELFDRFYTYACELGSSVGWSV